MRMPAEMEAGGRVVESFLQTLVAQGYVPESIAAYRKRCRHFVVWLYLPVVDSENVFLRMMPPRHRPLTSGGVSAVAKAAIERSGVKAEGLPAGHVFRHSAATNLLRDDTPLEVIGTLLRHQSTQTTAIYARVDVRMLREVAQPWPAAGELRERGLHVAGTLRYAFWETLGLNRCARRGRRGLPRGDAEPVLEVEVCIRKESTWDRHIHYESIST